MRHISRSRDSTKLRDWLPCQSNTLTSLAGLQIRIFTKCCITLNYRTRLNILKSALFLSRPLYLVSIYCLEMSSYVCSFFHAIPDFTHQRFLDFRVLSPKNIGYNLRHIIASWYLYIIYICIWVPFIIRKAGTIISNIVVAAASFKSFTFVRLSPTTHLCGYSFLG